MLLPIPIVCVEEYFLYTCNMMSQHIRRIFTLSNVQYMYSIHQHKRSPPKIKFAAAACDQSCCMDETSWCWVRLHMIYWHQSCFMDLLLVRRNNIIIHRLLTICYTSCSAQIYQCSTFWCLRKHKDRVSSLITL